MLKWLWLTAVVIALDMLTKAFASDLLVLHQPAAVFPGFNFTLMHNTGAAFSFLSEASGWQRWFFSGIALAVSAGIIAWLKKLTPDQTWTASALSLILGGALGNVWDRLTLGYVIDFIDVYYADAHWPAFNIADSAITVGAAILIFDSFRSARHAGQQTSKHT
jgi:signal peptidase II